MIKAAIFMGDPRYISGLPYNVGTCRAQGVSSLPSYHTFPLCILTNTQFAPRPAGFVCPSASKIQSYCDAADPYCCTGSDQATHQGYGTKYGQAALTFVNGKLAAAGTGGGTSPTTTAGSTPTATTAPGTGSGAVAQKYAQCGGNGWTGATTCVSGSTCKVQSQWYSQCL